MNKTVLRSVRRTLLVAPCICLVCTGALAAYLSANTDFFQTAFGRKPTDAVTEYNADGKMIKNIPTMERVTVEGEQADALLGDYIQPMEGPYQLETHTGPMTVEILGNVYDAAIATGIVAFTLERASGFPELNIMDTDGAYFSGDGLRLIVANGEAMFYDDERSTPTKAYLYVSYVQLDNTAHMFNLF